MSREFTYKIVGYDNVGMVTVEYSKEGSPTILRRVPINPGVAPEDLPTFIANAAQLSAPWDIWDADLDARAAVIQELIGAAVTTELPAQEARPEPQPVSPEAPPRRLSLAEELELWEQEING